MGGIKIRIQSLARNALIISALSLILINCASTAKEAQNKQPQLYQSHSFPSIDKARTPRLSSLSNGMLLSWVDISSPVKKLKFSRFIDNQWSKPQIVQQGTNWFINYADYASITALDDSHYVASWLEHTGRRWIDYRFLVSQSFDAGKSWSKPSSPIANNIKGQNGFLSVQINGSNPLFVWISSIGKDYAVQSASLNSKGEWLNLETVDTSSCSCCHTDMSRFGDQILMVYRDRTQDEIRDISLASLKNDQWKEQSIIENDGWKINGCPVNGPSITATESGYVIIWFSAANDIPAVKIKSFSVLAEEQTKTLGDDKVSGRVDSAKVSESQVMMIWLSENKKTTVNLQMIDLKNNNFSPEQSFPIENGVIGFPSISVFQNRLYITYETLKHEIKMLELGIESF